MNSATREWFDHRIPDYLDGSLDDEERLRFEGLLQQHEKLHADVEAIRKTIDAVKGVVPISLSPERLDRARRLAVEHFLSERSKREPGGTSHERSIARHATKCVGSDTTRRPHRRFLSLRSVCIGVGVLAILGGAGYYLWPRGTVEQYEVTPAAVEVTPDGRTAHIRDFGKNIQYSWETRVDNGIAGAALIYRPSGVPGSKLAVIAFQNHAESEFKGKLMAFDASSPQHVIWSRQLEVDQYPDNLPEMTKTERAPISFSPRTFGVFDVFPNSPGDEVVLVYQHSSSICALQVYSGEGDILYQAWADGNILGVYWVRDPGLLVCTGLNGTVFMKQRGGRGADYAHPFVLFAFRPVYQDVGPKWIGTPDFVGDVEVAWTLCLRDEPATNFVRMLRLTAPRSELDPSRRFNLVIELQSPKGTIGTSITLDGEGKEIDVNRGFGNDYKMMLLDYPNFPTPDQFELGPLPPIVDPEGVWMPGPPR